MAYREYRHCVTSSVKKTNINCSTSSFHIFSGCHGDQSTGLCLSALRDSVHSASRDSKLCSRCRCRPTAGRDEDVNVENNEEKMVVKTLSRLGRGIVLSRQPPVDVINTPHNNNNNNTKDGSGDVVWLYNCSDFPVFVDSVSLRHAVCKVLPGQSVLVYSGSSRVSMTNDCPWSSCRSQRYESILISFVKGWGGQYKRQSVLSCPCWLDITIDRLALCLPAINDTTVGHSDF